MDLTPFRPPDSFRKKYLTPSGSPAAPLREIPIALPLVCSYNTTVDWQATVLCETEKKRWLVAFGQ